MRLHPPGFFDILNELKVGEDMREKIYTIPINEAYDVGEGCPVCRLADELERASVEYIMGAAMMEPDVRTETNRQGFCARHLMQMNGMQKKLSLALVLESYLKNLDELLDAPKPEAALQDAANGCFVCTQMKDRLEKYAENIVYLWENELEFREKTARQSAFCPRHLALLFQIARRELPKRMVRPFFTAHATVARKVLTPLTQDVSKFCESFDHRNAGVPMGEEKTAVERAIAYLSQGEKSK